MIYRKFLPSEVEEDRARAARPGLIAARQRDKAALVAATKEVQAKARVEKKRKKEATKAAKKAAKEAAKAAKDAAKAAKKGKGKATSPSVPPATSSTNQGLPIEISQSGAEQQVCQCVDPCPQCLKVAHLVHIGKHLFRARSERSVQSPLLLFHSMLIHAALVSYSFCRWCAPLFLTMTEPILTVFKILIWYVFRVSAGSPSW